MSKTGIKTKAKISSKFHGVFVFTDKQTGPPKTKIIGTITHKHKRYRRANFTNERDAALWVDKKMIDLGLEPVNILKRK